MGGGPLSGQRQGGGRFYVIISGRWNGRLGRRHVCAAALDGQDDRDHGRAAHRDERHHGRRGLLCRPTGRRSRHGPSDWPVGGSRVVEVQAGPGQVPQRYRDPVSVHDLTPRGPVADAAHQLPSGAVSGRPDLHAERDDQAVRDEELGHGADGSPQPLFVSTRRTRSADGERQSLGRRLHGQSEARFLVQHLLLHGPQPPETDHLARLLVAPFGHQEHLGRRPGHPERGHRRLASLRRDGGIHRDVRGATMHKALANRTLAWTDSSVEAVFQNYLVPTLQNGFWTQPLKWNDPAVINQWWSGTTPLYFMGSWITGMVPNPANIDVFSLPGGGSNQGMVFAADYFFVPKYAAHTDLGKRLATFLGSAAAQTVQVQVGGHIATAAGVPSSAYPALDQKIATLLTGKVVLTDLDDTIGNPFQGTFWSQLQSLWANPAQWQARLTAIQAAAAAQP